jgi:ABC-type dipeptide/oligopeptide/nickel transport system permease subunit
MQIGQHGGSRLEIGTQLVQFLWQYKWWWLSPPILMLLLLAGLVIFAKGADHPAFTR